MYIAKLNIIISQTKINFNAYAFLYIYIVSYKT